MKCPTCPVPMADCLGESIRRLCDLARTRDDYRRLLVARAGGAGSAPAQGMVIPQAALAAVSACPHRGPVLPVGLQPECGCAELSECRADKGATPGRVTLRECLTCVAMTPGGT